ncbi:hypothetical protein ACJVC5_00705 [Peredibacter sp. HCB2-198]|uniref:Uncharacterized protein n=1 Tax=Peredibacter starrii TaxID=28202 RepID=A0AAX4HME0_9BACT|nr:hypothetical protein [Peredibacter starrii]WPU64467.1 hypothetical protein SOO65_17370 [Peredibacter starrii]
MVKNLILLGLLTWVSFSYAKHPVAQESMGDAESYKVEKAVEEQEAQRSVAGEKIKKQKKVQHGDSPAREPMGEPGSEVRYWQYSE